MMVSKTFSARFLMAVMLTATACLGFLKDKLSDEAFMSLAGAAITAYFMRNDRNQQQDVKPDAKPEPPGV